VTAGSFDFRRLTRDDVGLLATWLARPHVQRWWAHEFTPEALERDFGDAVDGTEPGEVLVVSLHGRAIGIAQCYRFADYPDYVAELDGIVEVPEGAASIDYFIGEPDLIGRGVGTRMLRAVAARTWAEYPDVSCLIVPVNSANIASWTALLRAGFTLAARGELEPDNPIDDRAHEVLRLDRPAS
jgi:aminoglycoside 6'-N-acetyltransferase